MAVISQKIKNGGIDPSYYDKTARAESGGRSDARNPNSSASGLYQFTKGTWRAVVDKYGLRYTDEDRFDKNKSREVMELFTRDNAEQLKQYGIQPNNTDLYTAHFMGVGGARKLLTTQRENPNVSVYNVATPAQIKANKSIFLHKDGSPKTVGQVYEILGDKINKTHNYATNYKKTDEYKAKYPTIVTDLSIPQQNTNLASVPEQETKEPKEVVSAKEELQQKQNEENFIADLFASNQQQVTPIVQVNPLESYAQIESFVDAQQGGKIIEDNDGYWNPENWGKIVEIASPNITMRNVFEPLLGISKQTGERKIMLPGKEYYFSNTSSVIEKPIIKRK